MNGNPYYRLNDLLPAPPVGSAKPKPQPKEALEQFKARYSL
jgi:hypothetical protein